MKASGLQARVATGGWQLSTCRRSSRSCGAAMNCSAACRSTATSKHGTNSTGLSTRRSNRRCLEASLGLCGRSAHKVYFPGRCENQRDRRVRKKVKARLSCPKPKTSNPGGQMCVEPVAGFIRKGLSRTSRRLKRLWRRAHTLRERAHSSASSARRGHDKTASILFVVALPDWC